MVGDAEQDVTGLEALAIDCVALENDAIAWSRPGDGIGHLPVALDPVDELLGYAEVEQAPPRADDATGSVLRRDCVVSLDARALLNEKPGSLVEQLLAEHRHQRARPS